MKTPHFKHILLLITSLFIFFDAHADIQYDIIEKKDRKFSFGKSKTLQITINNKKYSVITKSDVGIKEKYDFDNDGVTDALISTFDGGQYPEEYRFVTFKNGVIINTIIDFVWAEYSVVFEDGKALVKQKQDLITKYFAFDGERAVLVRTTKPMSALKEIYGVSSHYTGKEEIKTLVADIDLDGKPEKINCTIWPRWGSLGSCELPLPNGKKQQLSFSCHRFGIVKETSHGYRKIVCNSDTLFSFNGKMWVRENETK